MTEEELRHTRKWLADCHCIVDRVTVSGVAFNDKKAKLLAPKFYVAQGISANDSINELCIKKCKIRVSHIE